MFPHSEGGTGVCACVMQLRVCLLHDMLLRIAFVRKFKNKLIRHSNCCNSPGHRESEGQE